jgi:hypothetical protein
LCRALGQNNLQDRDGDDENGEVDGLYAQLSEPSISDTGRRRGHLWVARVAQVQVYRPRNGVVETVYEVCE